MAKPSKFFVPTCIFKMEIKKFNPLNCCFLKHIIIDRYMSENQYMYNILQEHHFSIDLLARYCINEQLQLESKLCLLINSKLKL